MIRQLSYLVFTLLMLGMICGWAANAETAYREVECPICGEIYTERYEHTSSPYIPIAMPDFYYTSYDITFNTEQPACSKCKEKYQQKIHDKMLSVFNEMIEEIKDENKEQRAINQEVHKQREIKALEDRIKILKGEIVEDDYESLTIPDEDLKALDIIESDIVFEVGVPIYDETP